MHAVTYTLLAVLSLRCMSLSVVLTHAATYLHFSCSFLAPLHSKLPLGGALCCLFLSCVISVIYIASCTLLFALCDMLSCAILCTWINDCFSCVVLDAVIYTAACSSLAPLSTILSLVLWFVLGSCAVSYALFLNAAVSLMLCFERCNAAWYSCNVVYVLVSRL